jgi:hypothetical protein
VSNPSADNVSSGVLTQHKWLAYNEQVDRLNAIRAYARTQDWLANREREGWTSLTRAGEAIAKS